MADMLQKPLPALLTHAQQHVRTAADSVFKERSGHYSYYFILLALQESDAATQRELAEEVGIRESTMTHHLLAMEELGFITRQRTAANRRRQEVRLTKKGHETYAALRSDIAEFDKALRQAIGTDDDVDRLQQALLRMVEVADDWTRTVP